MMKKRRILGICFLLSATDNNVTLVLMLRRAWWVVCVRTLKFNKTWQHDEARDGAAVSVTLRYFYLKYAILLKVRILMTCWK